MGFQTVNKVDPPTGEEAIQKPGTVARRLPVGAEIFSGGVHFRVWAPVRRQVSVVIEAGPGAGNEVELVPEEGGYFAGAVAKAGVGSRYRYRLNGDILLRDPASRFQPEGPHGLSEVVNPIAFPWRDDAWEGLELRGQVLYEMHIGTFTREGTWAAAERQLPAQSGPGRTALGQRPAGGGRAPSDAGGFAFPGARQRALRPRYFGSLRERDAAYHQGTVWAWLIGPWIDAWRKLHPDDNEGARRWLEPLLAHLDDFGVGSIAEIFDAEAPYAPRGCIVQARSVAEVLRQLIACDDGKMRIAGRTESGKA